jgi:hypothetical protein
MILNKIKERSYKPPKALLDAIDEQHDEVPAV